MATTGMELKLKRVEANVSGIALATKIGIEPYALSRIERRSDVDLDMVRRYLVALAELSERIEGNAA